MSTTPTPQPGEELLAELSRLRAEITSLRDERDKLAGIVEGHTLTIKYLAQLYDHYLRNGGKIRNY